MYDQVPHLFGGFRPFKKVPPIPFVKLKLMECADRATVYKKARKAWKRIDRERVEECKKLARKIPAIWKAGQPRSVVRSADGRHVYKQSELARYVRKNFGRHLTLR